MNDQSPKSPLQRKLSEVANLAAFAREFGFDRRMLDRYKDGMEPSVGNALRIAQAFKISLDELVLGTSVKKVDDFAQSSDSITIPLLNIEASAGAGVVNGDVEELTRLPFPRVLLKELGVKLEHAHFIRARGDSMAPTIADGAIVLIDTARRKDRTDGVYVLMLGEDVRIKRLAFGAFGALKLVSDNEAYPAETLSRSELDQIKIVGKVVWVGGGL